MKTILFIVCFISFISALILCPLYLYHIHIHKKGGKKRTIFLIFSTLLLAILSFYRTEQITEKEMTQNQHATTDNFTHFEEFLPRIGDTVQVKMVTKIKETYNVGYQDANGKWNWLNFTPVDPVHHFEDVEHDGNVKIVIDPTRKQNEFVRQNNDYFIEKRIFHDVKRFYPSYILYIKSESNIKKEKM